CWDLRCFTAATTPPLRVVAHPILAGSIIDTRALKGKPAIDRWALLRYDQLPALAAERCWSSNRPTSNKGGTKWRGGARNPRGVVPPRGKEATRTTRHHFCGTASA